LGTQLKEGLAGFIEHQHMGRPMSQSLRVHEAARLLIDDLIVLVDDVKDVFGGIHFYYRDTESIERVERI